MICVPGPRVLDAAEEALRQGRPRDLRDLLRLCRDRHRGTRPPDAAARARALTRGPAARAELPGDRLVEAEAERDLRAARASPGPDWLLVAVRRPRARAARAELGAARLLRLRLDREQGGRLLERLARVVGGRRRDRRRAALPGVVRQPTQVRPPGAACRPAQADPRAQGGTPRRPARRAASSHTAALAGSEAAVNALFRQAGVLRAQTLEELVDVAGLLSSQPLPRGRRVGVLTNAGGLGILCADACEAAGLELPELAEETGSALREVLPGEAASRTPSTCSARRPARPTSGRFRRCSPILDSMRSSCCSCRRSLPARDEIAAAISRAVERRAVGQARARRRR